MLLGIGGGNVGNGVGNGGGIGVGSSAPTTGFGAASAGLSGNGLLSMGSTPLPSPRPQ